MKRSSLGFIVPAVSFVTFFILERKNPLRSRRAFTPKRLFTNAAISALALAVSAAMVQPVVKTTSLRNSLRQKPHLKPRKRGFLPKSIVDFLLLDFAFYVWHRANHRLPFLWRFHNVHHLDPDLDVSTGPRFHPAEVALSAGFRFLQIFFIGASSTTVRIYDSMFQIATFFHHSNLDIGTKRDRRLNSIFVTPRMHGIHHSQKKSETNSNYSVIFSCWDRLCRTFITNVPQSTIQIGDAAHSDPKNNGPVMALFLPFRKQGID